MATSGMLICWSDVKPGREKMAGELYNATLAYYGKKVKDGVLTSFEPVILARRGSADINGFVILRGEPQKLEELRRADEFKNYVVQGTHCLQGFGVIDAYLGTEIQDIMQRWAAAIPR